MKHNLNVKVSKALGTSSAMNVKTVSIREKILRFLFGNKEKVTILVPGYVVDEVSINESDLGGRKYE